VYARGEVFNLKKVEDFEGKFAAGAAARRWGSALPARPW